MKIFMNKKIKTKLNEEKQINISNFIRENVSFEKIPVSKRTDFLETAVLSNLAATPKPLTAFQKLFWTFQKHPLRISLATIFSVLVALLLFFEFGFLNGNSINSFDPKSIMIYETEDGQVIIKQINYNYVDKNVKNL